MPEKTVEQKAQEIWEAMDENEQYGVRFGLFPAKTMQAAEREGFDGHKLTVALMAIASRKGGMRA